MIKEHHGYQPPGQDAVNPFTGIPKIAIQRRYFRLFNDAMMP